MIRVGYLAQAGRSAFDPVREEPGRPARLEELVECPVAPLSTSPDRDDTILVRDPFVD